MLLKRDSYKKRMAFEGSSLTSEKIRQSMRQLGQRRFDEAVRSLTKKLQPEYERIQKLKNSDTLSIEREQQILHARKQGESITFEEQERANQEIRAYNSKVEGIAMALTALSDSYGIHTFVARRFRVEYFV
jgi:hypothetical protein